MVVALKLQGALCAIRENIANQNSSITRLQCMIWMENMSCAITLQPVPVALRIEDIKKAEKFHFMRVDLKIMRDYLLNGD